MEVALTPKPRQAAKREIVRQFEHGVSAEDVRGRGLVPMHRTTIYRLLKRVQYEGEGAFNDGRHGHPVKLRGEIRAFLLEHCQNHPSVSSSAVQHLLAERFGLWVSVSQLNRVRATGGLSRQYSSEKKARSWLHDCIRLS